MTTAATELRLERANQVLQTSQDPDACRHALIYLRSCALDGDSSNLAKIKLSVMYTQGRPCVHPDATEAALWSRSIFDKQLSEALTHCQDAAEAEKTVIHHILHASSSDPYTSFVAGLVLSKGIGVAPNVSEAIQALEKAAEGGVAGAAYELGRIYGDRYAYSLQDAAQSLGWFERAMTLGQPDAVAELALGYHALSSDVDEHDMRMRFFARQGAEAGHKYCQYMLGHLESKNRATERDAMQWLSLSSQQGVAAATEELVGLHVRYSEYGEACRLCVEHPMLAYCQTVLGDLYHHGWGVTKDEQKAFQYYQNAVSILQPDTHPCYPQERLGEMFLHGHGVPQDLAVAKEWFQMAAAQGCDSARLRLVALDHDGTPQSHGQSNPSMPPRATSLESATRTPLPSKKSSRWSLGLFGRKHTNATA